MKMNALMAEIKEEHNYILNMNELVAGLEKYFDSMEIAQKLELH